MRLFAFLADDGPALGVLTAADRVVRLSGVDGGLDAALAEGRFEALVEEASRQADRASGNAGAGVARASLVPLPAVEFPAKIVCVGLNYAGHVAEGGRTGPDRPLLFAKFANTIVGDGEPIVRPEGTHALDLEVELGVVIGRRARRVAPDRAARHVAGYVVLNDVSARDWQGVPVALSEGEKGDGQWLRAKSSDTFLPVGPVFTTADDLDPTAGVRLRSWLIAGAGPDAGRPMLMQDASTAEMLRSVPDLIAFISRQITLEPGDLIATGTPSGVGVFRNPPIYLEPGDRVRCEVVGIGSVENPVIDWSDVPEDAGEID